MKFISVLLILALFCPQACLSEGNIKDLKLFEYWDSGKVKTCSVYDVNGFLKAKAFCRTDGTVEKLERFDKRGNKTETAFYNEKGMLKTGIDGWAARRWRYDGYQLIEQVSFDEDGRAIERKHYSDSGRLIAREYDRDTEFNPYESASMAMMLGGNNSAYYYPDKQ